MYASIDEAGKLLVIWMAPEGKCIRKSRAYKTGVEASMDWGARRMLSTVGGVAATPVAIISQLNTSPAVPLSTLRWRSRDSALRRSSLQPAQSPPLPCCLSVGAEDSDLVREMSVISLGRSDVAMTSLAQLTRMHHNRPPCHYCGNCVNGCDVGAMFNTIAVTLPPALKTGNLEVMTDCVVARVRMNNENRAQGVTYIERYTMQPVDVDAKYVILAASTLENTRLLMLSGKGGLANSSGTLGQYMMDQVGGGGVNGFLPKLKGGPSRLDDGKSAGISIPNFQNIDDKTASKDFIRGYVINATGGQTEFPQYAASFPGYGSEWKREVKSRYVAQARVWIAGGEMLAQKQNFVELDPEVKDHWGIPVLKIHFSHHDNDRKLLADFQEKAEDLFKKAGGEVMAGFGRGGPAGFPGGPGSPDAGRSSVGAGASREGTTRAGTGSRESLGGSIH